MRRPQPQVKPAFQPFSLDQHLSWYALAATAAGVGMLGSSQPCAAEIVYTKAHHKIGLNTTVNLDLNHDGIADFNFKDNFSTTFFSSFGTLSVRPSGASNQIWGHVVAGRGYASALFRGVRVGRKGHFLPGAGLMAATSFLGGARPASSGVCTGPWANVAHRYLGLKFVISGEVHFGWARLHVSCPNTTVTGVLTGYAYETVANRHIITGQEKSAVEGVESSKHSRTSLRPASMRSAGLGRLAQGAPGLAAWRGPQ